MFLRQGLVNSRLAPNSLCSWGWLWSSDPSVSTVQCWDYSMYHHHSWLTWVWGWKLGASCMLVRQVPFPQLLTIFITHYFMWVGWEHTCHSVHVQVRRRVSVIKAIAKINMKRKGFLSAVSFHFQVTVHCWGRTGAGTQMRQEPEGRNQSRSHGGALLTDLFLIAGSACFPIPSRTTCPGMAPPTIDWTLPYQLLVKKTPYRLAYGTIWWRRFLN